MTADTSIRENELAVELPDAEDATLRFVGRCRTPFTDRSMCPRQGSLDGPECRLVLDPMWQPALAGLERFDFADVLYWLDQSRRDLLTQSPKSDGQTVGTFALRSPVRPNPIGLSRIKIERIEGAEIVVRGLDCIDGTPLIDIKPERCGYTPQVPPKPGVDG